MRWTELSDIPQIKRFETLSEELKLSKFENEFVKTELPAQFLHEADFINEDTCEAFRAYTNEIKKGFDQIRVGGFFRDKLDLLSNEYPAELKQTKILDSLVKTSNKWWPRNQLYSGFISFLSKDIKQVDFSSPVLIVGTNSDSKTIISALIKMGFSHFNITDTDANQSRALVEVLKRNYFSTKFEMTEIGYVTQLPNIYSLGVNTLESELDETTRMALIYFNFLPKGAFWIESTIRTNSPLVTEARSFGFHVKLGLELAAEVDSVWAKTVLKCDIDVSRFTENLKTKLF